MHLNLRKKMSNENALVIVNYDASYLEEQSRALGYNVYVIDHHNYHNLKKTLTPKSLKNFISTISKKHKNVSLLYGSGLEGKKNIYKDFTKLNIKGNNLNLLNKCGNIYKLENLLKESGFQIPKILKNRKDLSKHKYLIKPINSCGGYDISFSNQKKENDYIQKYIPGITYSACFFLKKNSFIFLGFNKLFLLKKFPPHPFVHAGAASIRLIPFSKKIIESLKYFSIKSNMYGFNSIDFKIYDNDIYVLDVNPRITSTFKMYNDFYNNKLLKSQLSSDIDSSISHKHKVKKNYGFVHIFTDRDFIYNKKPVINKNFINLPKEGELIKKDNPIFSIYMIADNYNNLKNKLKRKISMTKKYYSCYDINI